MENDRFIIMIVSITAIAGIVTMVLAGSWTFTPADTNAAGQASAGYTVETTPNTCTENQRLEGKDECYRKFHACKNTADNLCSNLDPADCKAYGSSCSIDLDYCLSKICKEIVA